MTAIEKIKIFNSIDDIIIEIENDRNTNNILKNRYAVRFIMLDNFIVFQDLSLKLARLGINSLGLETLIPQEDKDKWITQDELKNAIKEIITPTIVSPFSEIARFYNDDKFRTFFNEISILENLPNNLTRRIYIPLIGLQNRFDTFLNSFCRIAESAPVWSIKTGETQPVKIYLTPSSSNFPQTYRGLETMYDWLLFWKTKAPTDQIICSSLPINVNYKYSQLDNIFEIQPIKTAYEFINQYLNLQIDIEYKESEENFWLELLSHFEKEKVDTFNFKTFVNKHFNVNCITIANILNIWTSNNTSDFSRWVLKHFFLLYLKTESKYLESIFENCSNYSNLKLFKEIVFKIFEKSEMQNFYEERNNLLLKFENQYTLSDSDIAKLKENIFNIAQNDTSSAIKLCSGKFDFEKELFLGWHKIGKLTRENLKNLYPDLFAYLDDCKIDNWANNYIQTYKKAKIEDKYTDDLKAIIADKNANEDVFFEWYHSFESSAELLAKEKPDKVYWVDGLGIEYFSLIQNIISKSKFSIQKLQIAKANIPSSTEHNKFDNVEKVEDLDNFIHSNLYQYPQTICKEIEVVKNIFKNILNETNETTIAIVSDHGLTALSRLVDSKKYTAKASHEGRYIKLENAECLEDSDYIRYKNREINYKVALTHASLNSKPVREVHGGCTPEEILVPYIIICNKRSDRLENRASNIDLFPKDSKQKAGFEEEDLF